MTTDNSNQIHQEYVDACRRLSEQWNKELAELRAWEEKEISNLSTPLSVISAVRKRICELEKELIPATKP